MAKILIVDDDGHIREVERFALLAAGHEVVEAKDGAEAVARFESTSPDLVLLDILMPEGDGLDVCRRIRQKSQTPIIFVSSRDDELDRVLGLELGADDYITKPFSPRELVARVKAVLRRMQAVPEPGNPEKALSLGPLVMNLSRHKATYESTEVVLTVTEFGLLATLIATPGKVFSRSELVDRAYGDGHVITERTVDSHVRRIRQKLAAVGADPVETVYGVGYRMRETRG